jgi:hypothetical protein
MHGIDSLIERCFVQRSIITLHRERRILQLEISTRCEIVKDLLRNGTVVLEASHDGSSMDVIKRLIEAPIFFCIVDLELAVCRDACILLGEK